ncbi:MAG: Asp-tRNA(Asn)/Glu-tRNA(Gln) amidotransferase subunit GatA [Ignavibacteriales bacterium]|nr:Asp-tRNA(Asn)/Glu-tRNA(Gln) amidotransferase subunit GatA [Ignavibacteriales bacterium]
MNLQEPFDSYRPRLASESCESRTRAHLEEIRKRQSLNAFLSVFDDEAIIEAKRVDERFARGIAGPLAGMVIAVKDVLNMKNKETTCGSKILRSYHSLYDATVIERLRAADAVFIGKTNMDEFAMGSSNENSAFGPVKNPRDESRVPGGSSGGSAAAVAAGLATTSLGTDTGGSIRQPAALCGIIGLKPTYGRVSRYGLVAFASSFDQIGPFGNSPRDVARVLQVIAGHDPKDSTSSTLPVPDYLSAMTGDVTGVKIGLPKEYYSSALSDEIRSTIDRAVQMLRDRGAIVSEVSLPHTEYTIATYYILATAEASSNLARFDGVRYGYRTEHAADLAAMYTKSRSEGFGAEVKRRIMLGTYVLSAGYYDAYYAKAQKVRRLIQHDFFKAFEHVDCLLTPTTPSTAFRMGEKMDDPLQMYLSDIYTVSANLAGIPGISVPAAGDEKLPVGIQILGRQFDEATILNVAEALSGGNQ